MEPAEIKPILESLIFVSQSPIRLETLLEVLAESTREALLEAIEKVRVECGDDSKGIELVEVAGGYQFRTKPKCAEWINRLKKAKSSKLSQSALETLAIVAYRQPVIRPEIEQIRGVDSGWILRSLMEKGLVRITGRKDIPGRPLVYGTTKAFLELFGLNLLSDLPTLKEVQSPPSPEEAEKLRRKKGVLKKEIASTEAAEISEVLDEIETDRVEEEGAGGAPPGEATKYREALEELQQAEDSPGADEPPERGEPESEPEN